MVRSVKLRVVGCPYGDSRDDRVTAVDGQAPDWAWERRRSGMRGGRWRVKGERDAGTAAGLAKRCCLASAAGSGTALRRRVRRSGPLTRLTGEYPGGRDRRSSRLIGDGCRAAGNIPSRRATRPPNPASRRGRGFGGWPPARGCGPAFGVATLIQRRAPGPCRRQCAGTARGARSGRGARRGGRSPRRRPRRAGRSPCPA